MIKKERVLVKMTLLKKVLSFKEYYYYVTSVFEHLSERKVSN